MICPYCGKEIDSDIRVCPYCANLIEYVEDTEYYEESPGEYVEEGYAEGYGHEETYAEDEEYAQQFVDDDPVLGSRKKFGGLGKKVSKPSVSMPRTPKASGLPLSTVLSVVCCLISLFCLISIKGVQKDIEENNKTLLNNINSVYSSVSALDDRLASLDTTLAGVQNEAYNQLASQSIVISKDITALTGPVTEGKYNVMFIINAKGNLNLNDSFDWQKYNQITGGWESIVFTGNATTNEQYGLRLENAFNREENHYESKLWANGITPEAAGTYRCVIKDATGITKTSAEASVQVG